MEVLFAFVLEFILWFILDRVLGLPRSRPFWKRP
jgi:hypothetical protein